MRGVVWVATADGPTLGDERSAADLLSEAWAVEASWVAIPLERLDPDFLALSNRKAGNFLQKFSTYRMNVAIVGDIAAEVARSEALAAFVRESNRGAAVWFVDDLAALDARLSEATSEA